MYWLDYSQSFVSKRTTVLRSLTLAAAGMGHCMVQDWLGRVGSRLALAGRTVGCTDVADRRRSSPDVVVAAVHHIPVADSPGVARSPAQVRANRTGPADRDCTVGCWCCIDCRGPTY